MNYTRRYLVSALGLVFPIGFLSQTGAENNKAPKQLLLQFRPFEEALRRAFESHVSQLSISSPASAHSFPCCRIEIGHSEDIQAGVQGCYNDRPFAGYPTAHLRIVRTASQPGPLYRGVRLYVATVDVLLTGGKPHAGPGRPLDFSTLPPAPVLS